MGAQAFRFSPFVDARNGGPNGKNGPSGQAQPGNIASDAAAKPPPSAPDPAVLAKARAQGLAEGRKAAEAEFAASQRAADIAEKEARAQALAAASQAFTDIAHMRTQTEAALSAPLARLAAAMLQRVMSDLSDDHAHQRAEKFVAEVARAAAGAVTLHLRVGPAVQAIAEEAQGQARVDCLEIVVDDTLGASCINADWGSGSATYDPQADTDLLADAFQRAYAALAGEAAAAAATTPNPDKAPPRHVQGDTP